MGRVELNYQSTVNSRAEIIGLSCSDSCWSVFLCRLAADHHCNRLKNKIKITKQKNFSRESQERILSDFYGYWCPHFLSSWQLVHHRGNEEKICNMNTVETKIWWGFLVFSHFTYYLKDQQYATLFLSRPFFSMVIVRLTFTVMQHCTPISFIFFIFKQMCSLFFTK